MNTIDFLEEIRRFGQIKNALDVLNSDFLNWVMRVGECRNILNNSLTQFTEITNIMRQLEHDIPQFHKQPARFKEFEQHILQITSVISKVNNHLASIPKTEVKAEPVSVDEVDEEDESTDY
jgi:predicted translin family RNA/ssDNA-binding protein